MPDERELTASEEEFVLATPACPTCGQLSNGTVESLAARAHMQVYPDGRSAYTGYTEVWWEEQRTKRNDAGALQLICPAGHEWFSQVCGCFEEQKAGAA